MPRFLALAVLSFLVPAAAAAQAPPQNAATLLPGDVVRVVIWREEDLSGEFPVNERGVVTLPLLGDRPVAGVPVPQLRDEIVAAYRQQLRNPSITVTPLRRVTVLGEVNKPGLYPVDLTVTVAELLGIAGGVSREGDPRAIRIVRNGQVVRDRLSAEAGLAESDIRSGDQLTVGRRGWLDRNSGALLTSAISLIATAVSTLIIVNSQSRDP